MTAIWVLLALILYGAIVGLTAKVCGFNTRLEALEDAARNLSESGR